VRCLRRRLRLRETTLKHDPRRSVVGIDECHGRNTFRESHDEFALWPFTRFVYAFSAPIGYLFRPYIVYRSREATPKDELVGSRPRRRGW
jgi:hypothetical protein